jgi:hypothetical protein
MADYRNITEREKAVIKYAVAFGITHRQDLYRLAYNGTLEQVAGLADLGALASRWYNSKKIQDFLQVEMKEHEIRKERIRDEIRQEMEEQARKEGKEREKASSLIDYSDERNIIKKLNQLINTAKDDSEALDAVKTMAALLKQREDLRSSKEKDKVARFYLPLRCHQCPLYRMGKDLWKRRSAQHYESAGQSARDRIDEELRAAGPQIALEFYNTLFDVHDKAKEMGKDYVTSMNNGTLED